MRNVILFGATASAEWFSSQPQMAKWIDPLSMTGHRFTTPSAPTDTVDTSCVWARDVPVEGGG